MSHSFIEKHVCFYYGCVINSPYEGKIIMYFTKVQASEYLKKLGISISENTLSKYITVGGGPEYFKFNRKVLYTQETLDKWVSSKLSKMKTSSSSC